MNAFGDYLRSLRGERSLREVQNQTGISHTYLSTLEKGVDPRTNKARKPSNDVLSKLALFYGIPYIDLLKKLNQVNFDHLSIEYINQMSQLVNVDIYNLLENSDHLYFKNHLLTTKEKTKIKKMIEAIID